MQALKKALATLGKATLLGLTLVAAYVGTNVVINYTTRTEQTPEAYTVEPNPTSPQISRPNNELQNPLVPLTQAWKGEAKARKAPKVIVLTSKNSLSLRDVVMPDSVAKIQDKAIQLSQKLDKNEPIYLVLDTPGGSVDAGNQMIETLLALPNRVDTITIFAASMGFQTVQGLGKRYITPSGTLMSHRAAGGVRGQIPGEAVTRLRWMLEDIQRMETRTAARLNMSLQDYQALIWNEYWVSGENAIKEGMADEEVLMRCDSSLSGTKTEKVYTFFGPIKLVWSNCPLITYPLDVDLSDLWIFKDEKKKDDGKKKEESMSPAELERLALQRAELKEFINLLYRDKASFVKKYVVTGEYERFLVK